MENASKALLIAGGMLMVMLVIGLVLYVRQNYSDYYASQEEFKNIENVTQFNKQFTSYERNDVKGNELISLINKIIDYNDRMSDEAKNNSQGKPIAIIVDLVNSNERKKFLFNTSSSNQLFNQNKFEEYGKSTSYSHDEDKYSFKNNITKKLKNDIDKVGNEKDIAKIAKDIKAIFEPSVSGTESSKGVSITQKQNESVNKYNSYISTDKKISGWDDIKPGSDIQIAVYQYYEYVQFKKGIFKCTGVEYDTDSGKVEKISFEFTGKIQ